MPSSKLSGYFVFLTLLTLIAIFFMIVHQSYSNYFNPSIQVKNSQNIPNLKPELNIDIITKIESREELPPGAYSSPLRVTPTFVIGNE